MTQRKIQYWVIPPKANGEFTANMEKVLHTYAIPYNRRIPVVCMDEQPVQLLEDINIPIAATRNHAKRVDYEYGRKGTVSLFMFAEPLSGWRNVEIRERRTKIDWAQEMERLLTTRYADAEKVIVVCDNLNTHTIGAFYETFPPERAFDLVQRIELCFTPKHGSWLNIAENELSCMTRQCVHGRRFSTIEELRSETQAWASDTNDKQRGVDWQFKINDARTKLKSLYPKIKSG